MAPPVREPPVVEQGAHAVANVLGPRQETPIEAIRDMCLPPKAREYLDAPLRDLGLEIWPGIIRVSEGVERHYSVIGKDEQQRIVLHIKSWILDGPNELKFMALTSLPSAFEEGTRLYILSEGLDIIPSRAYRRMILEQWPRRQRVMTTFVPWVDIKSLQGTRAQQDLKEILELEVTQPAPSESSADDITSEEIQRLVKIVSGWPDFLEPNGRSVAAFLAGLREVLSGFDYTGGRRVFAGKLIMRLLQYGEVEDGQHVLGMLLHYLSGLDDMPRDDKEFMDGVIRKYRLMPH
jgi:hypothetical protein